MTIMINDHEIINNVIFNILDLQVGVGDIEDVITNDYPEFILIRFTPLLYSIIRIPVTTEPTHQATVFTDKKLLGKVIGFKGNNILRIISLLKKLFNKENVTITVKSMEHLK